ncbi:MAG: AMP-binding protein [Magnetococcales bacterium]|nr:AMP-binding protein [Magnetococcales bacterium]
MNNLTWLTHADSHAPALRINGVEQSYSQLFARAEWLSRAIDWHACGPLRLLAILGNHDAWVYAAMLAAHRLGGGFLPLHPAYPTARLLDMLQQTATKILLVTADALHSLDSILSALHEPMLCILPEESMARSDRATRFPQHRFLSAQDLHQLPARDGQPPPSGNSCAYLMFTSGSTGRAKGVAVCFDNLRAYVDYWLAHHPIGRDDRVAQPADITFDLSIHPIFVSWASQALLCPIPPMSRLAPARFILEHQLTIWVSVPSVAMMMERLKILQPAIFPSIRLSLFCGEPLPTRTAEAWRLATSNGRLLNLYGPTEATVAITSYEWDANSANRHPHSGNVPIGWIFPGQQAALLPASGDLLFTPGEGDLCLSGSQVTAGYLADSHNTANHYFLHPTTGSTLWYRTGDWVRRDEDGCLHFLSRVDFQIKLHGYRIELAEIESLLRELVGHDWVAVIPWPGGEKETQTLIACVAGHDTAAIPSWLEKCRQRLPAYMVPSQMQLLPELPLNSNGKINRAALRQHLQQSLFIDEAT